MLEEEFLERETVMIFKERGAMERVFRLKNSSWLVFSRLESGMLNACPDAFSIQLINFSPFGVVRNLA